MSDWLREADVRWGCSRHLASWGQTRVQLGQGFGMLVVARCCFFPNTTERHALFYSEVHFRASFMPLFYFLKQSYCQQGNVRSQLINQTINWPLVTLTRSAYFSSALKLSLHDVFSPACLCVEFHQASEEGGWVIALRKPTQWVEPPTYTHVHPQNRGQQTTLLYLSSIG